METIAAIATPPGQGAIAVLRISGKEAVAVADRVFRGRRPVSQQRPRVQCLGALYDGERKLDEVLLTVFRAPASFTGEDVVEIACHGGSLVTRRILELLLRNGASAAGPGEFSRRAYLNGKMDLTQAEAIMDLIGAQGDHALKLAAEQLEGSLGGQIRTLRAQLLELLAHIEAYIDFPEEDISPDTGAALDRRLREIRASLARLLGTAGQGRVLREGARTVISGAPNVGKSSLLNRLLGFDRAIVSPTAGTTRDTLEEVVMVRGWALRLVDTAGLRDSADAIEQEGILRARQQMERADLILHVADGSRPREEAVEPSGGAVVRVLNKSDLGEDPSWTGVDAVRVSCATGAGFDELEAALEERLTGGLGAGADGAVAINARHQDCLRRALEYADAAARALEGGLSPEFVAEELRGAMDAVGEVVGRADAEELLGVIFGAFCIGK